MPEQGMNYRNLILRQPAIDSPETLDEETRSVAVVAATEDPVEVWDWERYEVIREVLLMDGCVMPADRSVILVDSHKRRESADVLGSLREMEVAGDELEGRIYFSTAPEVESTWIKVKEKHLRELSLGYETFKNKSEWIPEGETTRIGGKTYEGPIMIRRKWRPRELSVLPLGADERAKTRSGDNLNIDTEDSEMKMNQKLREALIARGMPENATDDEAWIFLADFKAKSRGSDPPETETENAEIVRIGTESREAGVAAERQRVTEINAMGARFNVPDETIEGLINDGKTVDQARTAILDYLSGEKKKTGTEDPQFADFAGTRFQVTGDEKIKFREAAEDALMIRLGTSLEKPAMGAEDLTGWSMVEIARRCLVLEGESPKGRPLEMMGRALTTSDLPYILSNVANKQLFRGWEEAEETWMIWVETGNVSDFKINSSPRLSEASDLDEVKERQEYKYGKFDDAQEQYQIATFGKIFAITRQAMINDDLDALDQTPYQYGASANRKVGDCVYAVLTANAAMGDGTALFHTDHLNLAAGGNVGPLGVAAIQYHIMMMRKQKGIQGVANLNIRPRFFLGPATIEGPSEVFFTSDKFVDSDTVATDSSLAATRNNPYSGEYFTRVYDSRLDDDSETAYYFAAARGKTVKVFFLDGVQEPYLESKEGWTVDGIENKVRIDCGAKAMDWRGLSMNPGA